MENKAEKKLVSRWTLIPAISPDISSTTVTLYPRRWAHNLYICMTIAAQSMLSVPPAPAWTYMVDIQAQIGDLSTWNFGPETWNGTFFRRLETWNELKG